MLASAIVQAVAAAVIAIFTFALWRSTNTLAQATKTYVVLTEQMARLQSVELAQRAQAGAPSLIAAQGDRSVGDNAVGVVRIENVGGSAAYDIEVDTSWGKGRIPGPLQAGSRLEVPLIITRDDWEARSDKDPVIQGFRFKDPLGNKWDQSPGEAPVRQEE